MEQTKTNSAIVHIQTEADKRVNRILGQVRGIKKMIDQQEQCPDILTQISAIRASLLSLSTLLLENHINHCVRHDIENGGFEKVEELKLLLSRLIK